ncbi:MAG: hypothetical protein AABX49_00185, partial [Nanoarchaeota archaeon]
MFFKRLIRNKKLVALILIISIILIIFLGAKIYFYLNFLIGNDIIIKLNVNKEYVYLVHGETDILEFETKVTTNPFCSAVCTSSFIDVSRGVVLDQSKFSVKPGNPFKQAYEITSKSKGIGKDVYNYELECNSAGRFLCHSNPETSSRNILVVAEYDFTDEEKTLKKLFGENSLLLADEINIIKNNISSLKPAIDKLAQMALTDFNFSYSDDLNSFQTTLALVAFQEDYFIHIDELNKLMSDFLDFKINFLLFQDEVVGNLSAYNSLIDDLILVGNLFENLSYSTDEELAEIKSLGKEFNLVVEGFSVVNKIEIKKDLVEGAFMSVSNYSNLSRIGNKVNLSELELKEINFSKIEISDVDSEIFRLEFFPYEPMCCRDNDCTKCCAGNECSEDANAFPVVFLHGHSVTKDLPLEYSLEGFRGLQEELEKESFLNVGAITLYTKKEVPAGIWNFNFPLSIRGSYYFDFFEEPENYKIVLTKSENIDTYAVRLKEVFDNVRFRTGKSKINVIAFSMGGLVVRRHMQLFGSEGFDKVILIGTPNKGISGDISTLCPLAGGEKRECDDMNADGLFMQKLNREKVPDNIYNIYATGCEMSGGDGDGIVLEESAKIDTVNNFVINGTCRGRLQPLHLDLMKINLYPEVYE